MKVSTYMPIYATARFEIEIEKEEWDRKSDEDKLVWFLNQMECDNCICCHCSDFLDTDLVPTDSGMDAVKLTDLRVEEDEEE